MRRIIIRLSFLFLLETIFLPFLRHYFSPIFTNIWRLFQIAYPDQKRVLLISSQASAWWSVNLFKIVRNWLGRIPRVLKKRSCRFARSRSPARSEGIPQSIICFCSDLRRAKGLKNRYTWPRSYGVRLTGTLVPRKEDYVREKVGWSTQESLSLVATMRPIQVFRLWIVANLLDPIPLILYSWRAREM